MTNTTDFVPQDQFSMSYKLETLTEVITVSKFKRQFMETWNVSGDLQKNHSELAMTKMKFVVI